MIVLAIALLTSPKTDARLANSYRESKAGWVYAHLQGSPSEIGYQYGSLLAPEIDDAQKALHEVLQKETGKDWTYFRDTSKKLFWNKIDPEYQQEIEGQAEGLKSKGFAYDQWDVLAMNAYIEVSEYYMPWLIHQASNKTSCSAFIATGDYTKGGQIVMGHNFWWDYEMGERFNAVLDIQPHKGHRFVMDALCGFIHSGSDFAVNDAGMLLCETTIAGAKGFDPNGTPEFVRMRKSIQYSDNLDSLYKIMTTGNNGGYANTWLLGDTKTGEIGKLELGLKNVTFDRTKSGAYVGSNFPENPKLIAEETNGWDPNPQTNGCEARRARWNFLMTQNKGAIDAEMAKTFLADTTNQVTGQVGATDSTLCGKSPGGGANNAKVITSDMAKHLEFWARMGMTDGSPLPFPNRPSPLLRDLTPHPWITFHPRP